jgi:hypothetical protein
LASRTGAQGRCYYRIENLSWRLAKVSVYPKK